jgi:cytosine deaminase
MLAFDGSAPYRLAQATVPACLLEAPGFPTEADLVLADIDIAGGRIAAITPAGSSPGPGIRHDLARRMVFPCFVDLHTHIDKGHIWDRAGNSAGTHDNALASVGADRGRHWNEADVARRMDFSLRNAWAHGTAALRTHIDSLSPQGAISWPAFAGLRDTWSDRLALQAVSIVPLDMYRDADAGRALADLVADHDGLLGAVILTRENVGDLLDRVFTLAAERDLDIDFHVDETLDPQVRGLEQVAAAVRRHRYEGRVTAGHCCSLSAQPPEHAAFVCEEIAGAGVAIVSLPMCNLFLQDGGAGRTPRLRGVTALHELRAAGASVSIASDNTRDPFYAYGDLDMFEVMREGIRIGQLDRPLDDWPRAFTMEPADVMGLSAHGSLKPGGPADMIVFEGRRWSELLARPESGRTVIRAGQPVNDRPPPFSDLDDLTGLGVLP